MSAKHNYLSLYLREESTRGSPKYAPSSWRWLSLLPHMSRWAPVSSDFVCIIKADLTGGDRGGGGWGVPSKRRSVKPRFRPFEAAIKSPAQPLLRTSGASWTPPGLARGGRALLCWVLKIRYTLLWTILSGEKMVVVVAGGCKGQSIEMSILKVNHA